jgi:hypothetical protein
MQAPPVFQYLQREREPERRASPEKYSKQIINLDHLHFAGECGISETAF